MLTIAMLYLPDGTARQVHPQRRTGHGWPRFTRGELRKLFGPTWDYLAPDRPRTGLLHDTMLPFVQRGSGAMLVVGTRGEPNTLASNMAGLDLRGPVLVCHYLWLP